MNLNLHEETNHEIHLQSMNHHHHHHHHLHLQQIPHTQKTYNHNNPTTEVDWAMLDKSRFFLLGAALFSGVSATLYPAIVLKTRQQVTTTTTHCYSLAIHMLRNEGFRSFYRGFGTSLIGTIPARALYMTALELTKTNMTIAGTHFGLSEPTTAAFASASAGLAASVAAQLVWTPVDVVSQRLMVQGQSKSTISFVNRQQYGNGLDCMRKIIRYDGVSGLYRGFGISILTYAPSSAVWWGSYSLANRLISSGIDSGGESSIGSGLAMVGVQGLSAAMASGVSAMVTMPFDTVKTRLQVTENWGGGGGGGGVVETVKGLVKEGGLSACYRGLGPRWASMSVSAATMVTTYEFLKKMSTKQRD